MRYRHVIWDFNGTLLDDAKLCWHITNDQLIGDGRDPISFDRYLSWIEYPIQVFYGRLGYHLSAEEFAQASEDYDRIYGSRIHEAVLQEGALAALKALRDMGITQSILSAYHQGGLDTAVERLEIGEYFIDIVGMSDKLAGSKVQNALDWLERRGLSPAEIVMIGDTLHDAEVTAALGCDCILYSGGHNGRARLVESGLPVIDHMDELLPLILD